jgi:glycerophosphoryl diester phosphodiesterase
MYVPALKSEQGLKVTHGAKANGYFTPQLLLSRYTMIFDVFWPSDDEAKWSALYQVDDDNSDDADLFVQHQSGGALGTAELYHGSISRGEWHRIVIVVRAADGEGHMQKFVDGTFVGGQGTTGSPIDQRWALASNFLLFADDDAQTSAVYVGGFAMLGEALSFDQVLQLGGPTSAGPHMPGAKGVGPTWKSAQDIMVFGHRGDSCCAPENTVAAIESALSKGAHHVEIDIRLSSDNIPVLMHDESVDRTTNGQGDVDDFTAAELTQLDAGAFFGPEYVGTRVPTLAEALKALKGRGRAYLDIKNDGMASPIKAAIEEAGVPLNSVWCWLTDEDEIDVYARVMPGVPLLIDSVDGWREAGYFDRNKAKGVEGFSIPHSTFDAEFAAAAKNAGMFVEVFTILDPKAMQLAIESGVHGIETDYPAVLRGLLP